MLITPFERARFHVESGGETFLVDLLPHRGAGCCGCFHYLKHLRRENEAAAMDPDWRPDDSNRCPHIRAARGYLLDRFIEQLAAQFGDAEIEPT